MVINNNNNNTKNTYFNLSKVEGLWVGHSGCPPTVLQEIANLKACWPIVRERTKVICFIRYVCQQLFCWIRIIINQSFPPHPDSPTVIDQLPVTSVTTPNPISGDPRAASIAVSCLRITLQCYWYIIHTPPRIDGMTANISLLLLFYFIFHSFVSCFSTY